MDIPLEPAESSMIAALGYDAASRTLRVRFVNSSTWDYIEVPTPTYIALARAASIGGFFNAHIRGAYASQRVDRPPEEPPAAAPRPT